MPFLHTVLRGSGKCFDCVTRLQQPYGTGFYALEAPVCGQMADMLNKQYPLHHRVMTSAVLQPLLSAMQHSSTLRIQ